ncbi:DUF5133 domain-containing protein [Streptomyces echinoruber]|uniref:DUF5133 domain-containing protein n=1 Tax=Streptomyces echinoruber TaxID=68898 RepID=A0A918RH91_9ACTN|nr:DUF5133 domain-containing protein [Streptomyces echinoruber]GGZ96833.1 hypothetical protein GCM10010389_40170 [Streptomyces echinoruber]
MLTPHPALLRRLVDDYEEALAEEAADPASGAGTRAQDLAYTLCVSTATRDVEAALETARRILAESATAVEPAPYVPAPAAADPARATIRPPAPVSAPAGPAPAAYPRRAVPTAAEPARP